MRNGDWDALDDGYDDRNKDVEYVGMVESEPTVSMGSNGLKRVQSSIRGVPMRASRPARPAHPAYPDTSMRIPTPSGSVTLNPDAVRSMKKAPVERIGNQFVRRAAPGTYVVMAPNRGERLYGMGQAKSGGGGSSFDWGGFTSGLLEAAGQVTGQALEFVQGREELRARTAAERAAREAQAAESAAQRQSESEQAQREFELQMERIRTLREEGRESEARALEQRAPAAPPAGASPVVWVVIALLGAGAIGAVVWGVTKKKKD
jgi:hypothetical protein